MKTINADNFIENYFSKEKPCVLNNFSEYWECVNKWNYSFFQKNYPKLKVKYNNITQGKKKSKMSPPFAGEMLLVDFIDVLKRNEESEKRLFNFNLLQKCKELKKDFLLDRKWIKGFYIGWKMLFFGAKGSKVRLHYDIDFCPNFLTQLEGTKTIWLFPPEQTKYLYKYPFSVHSPIDFKNPDHEKYPLFKKSIPQKFVIEKGDTLFIPPGWWHYIEYTSSGYGISIKTFPNNIKYLLKGIYNIIFVLTIDSILHTLMPTIWDRFKNRKFQS